MPDRPISRPAVASGRGGEPARAPAAPLKVTHQAVFRRFVLCLARRIGAAPAAHAIGEGV